MATIDSLITEARYDLRDPDSTLFKQNAELLAYANRGLRQLDNVLSAMNSDWVYTESDVTLLISKNFVAVPTGCMVVRSAWINDTELIKKTPAFVYRKRKFISATGTPYYFSEAGANMIFDYTSDQAYTIKTYYDLRATTLVAGASMPYNDEFNDLIREMIVILGHKRNENDSYPDSQIYNFFMEKAFGNVVRRNHVPKRRGLDF